LLQQIKGIDKDNDLLLILTKLDTQIKYHTSRQEDVISIQNSEPATGYHFIDDIYEAIQGKTALKILYKPYQKNEFESVIHPYHLRQYNNRWFLFGWEEERQYVANLALDRMLKIRPISKSYKSPEGIFSANDYFRNMIGVTRSLIDTPQKIKLVFNKERAPYVITKPIHQSQQVTKLKNGKVRIELQLIINKELEQLILSFGSDVSIYAPESLKNKIRLHSERILKAK
jgi:predicted DNA-binding transcriptional regulator YafY